MAAELATGSAGLGEGVGLYHMLLEGVVFDAGQHALLDDLADGALPGVREGVERVELDERWHIGFGLRSLIESQPSTELLDDLLVRAEEAAEVWGDAVPAATREGAAHKCARRLSVVHLIDPHAQRRRSATRPLSLSASRRQSRRSASRAAAARGVSRRRRRAAA